jgi:hypothetical protein
MKHRHVILLAALALAGIGPRASAQAIVELGSAADFAVLAGSGITITGAVSSTTITGDLGSFPTALINGLGNVTLNGTNHAGDALTQAAKTDLLAAFNDAAGRTPDITYGAIFDLGGLTLPAGVYNDPSSFAITGMLTLDGAGNPNSVWIFQAGSTLTTTGTSLATEGSSQVNLINGARASNVFWIVGSSATLAGPSGFVGTVIAQTSITLTSGANVEGRILALDGAVSLNANSLSVPAAGSVPEPAATSLAIAGLLGLAVALRKLRR